MGVCINKINFAVISIMLLVTSCASFMLEKEAIEIKEYETRSYMLQKAFSMGDRTLNIGQKINIFIKVEKESIKVYGYDASVAFLKSHRILILYLFNDDFHDKRYNKQVFEEKLFSIAKPEGL